MGVDLDQFRRKSDGQPEPRAANRLPRHKPGKRFLKGPIPAEWLSRAASLPGKALHVGLAVWFSAGLAKGPRVRLSGTVLAMFGVDRRHTAYRALERLEAANLVTVDRHPGRNPLVTLRDA